MLTHQDWETMSTKNQELSRLAERGDDEALAKAVAACDWPGTNLADFDYYTRWCRDHWGVDFKPDQPPLSLVPHTGRILDVGFGYGFLLTALARRTPPPALYGIDSCELAIELQQSRTPTATLRVADCAQIPWPDGFFQTLIATEVVEHLAPAHAQRAYREMGRVSAPDAQLLLTTRINENLGRSLMRCPHCRAVLHPAGHVRSFTKVLLLAELRIGGWHPRLVEESVGGILVQCAKDSS